MRAIEQGVADPTEHGLLMACWLQRWGSKGLEDAHHIYASLSSRRSSIMRLRKRVESMLARGQNVPLHCTPFESVLPLEIALKGKHKPLDDPKSLYLRGAVERDLLISRLKEVLSLSEGLDLASVEEEANARILASYHKLHDLSRRTALAKQLADSALLEEQRLSHDEAVRLQAEMRKAVREEQMAKAESEAHDAKQESIDKALANYNHEMAELHTRYRAAYEEVMQKTHSRRLGLHEKTNRHNELRHRQTEETNAIKARYEHALRKAERIYKEALMGANQRISEQIGKE